MPPFKAEFRRTLERDARQRLEELLPLAARAECNTSVILADGKASQGPSARRPLMRPISSTS